MIELLLQAERALSAGHVDLAARMYAQAAAADPRSSIAVVGLARVALEREDDATAYRLAKQALGIDPENVAAARLVDRLEELYSHRGQPVPGAAQAAGAEATVEVVGLGTAQGSRPPAGDPAPVPAGGPSPDVAEAPAPTLIEAPAPALIEAPAPTEAPAQQPAPTRSEPDAPPARRSLIHRLLGRNQR